VGITDILGGSILDGVSKVISLFKVPPEKQLEAQTELSKIQMEMQGKLQDALTAEIQAAAGNIQADAKSGDKFTARARPSFMYIVEVILACNYIAFPLMNRAPLALPDALFWLFGSAVLGYTGARTWEKMQGPGAK
jgi:Holin of 3TMs, for gene-transfer release